MTQTAIALVPARAGSQRVPGKNIRPLAGHPLIAYAIAAACASNIFSRVIVSTDSEEIRRVAIHYGAEAPFLRPAVFASAVSPDIEWITHVLGELGEHYDAFSIVRPTSPFRTRATIQRAWAQLQATPEADSIRAVELVKQHPGKMWIVEGKLMRTLMDQSHLEVAWHAGQYQSLPRVYVQNSALEIAWTRVVEETHTREGRAIAPFLTDEREGFSIDYEYDWRVAELMVQSGEARTEQVSCTPYHPPAGGAR